MEHSLCVRVQSCQTLCNPMDCSPPGFCCPRNFSGKSTGMGCHCPHPGDPQHHLVFPALAGRFSPTCTTWRAHGTFYPTTDTHYQVSVGRFPYCRQQIKSPYVFKDIIQSIFSDNSRMELEISNTTETEKVTN